MCESVLPIRHLLAPLARFSAVEIWCGKHSASSPQHVLRSSRLFPVLQPLRDFLTIDILDPCACLI
jgi:hypothetical protein